MTAKKFWGWFFLAWVLTGIPIFLLHGVPGVDAPNHVARLHVLAALQQDRGLASYYQLNWAILPNLAVDLFITPIVYFFNVNALSLMKVFLVNTMGVTGAGFALTNRAITGRWSAWGLFGLLFSYSYVLGFGFINYLFGIGLALLFIGVQLMLKQKPLLRLAVVATGFPILLLNHLLALALGAMALLILAIWQRDKCRHLWIGFTIGTALSLVYMKLAATVGVRGASLFYDPMPDHFRNVFFPLYFSNLFRDLTFWLVLIGVVAVLMFKVRKDALLRRAVTSFEPPNSESTKGVTERGIGSPELADGAASRELPTRNWSLPFVMLVVFLLVGLALPHMAMTSAFLSGRISIWAILIAGAMVERISISPALILGLLFARSADIGQRFLTWNVTFDELRSDLRVVEDGGLVYQVTSLKTKPLQPPSWNPSIIHANCLVLLERNCFVNNLFSLPYQQPLKNSSEIKFDLRDLYTTGQEVHIESRRDWIVWHLGMMSDRLKKRPVYVFFVKTEKEGPSKALGKVLVERPRYIIYQLR